LILLLFAACATDSSVPPGPDSALAPLPDERLARRMSLDLRGVLPTNAELDALAAGDTSVDTLRDTFLDDPRFEERLVQLLGQAWRTQVDEFLVNYYEYAAYAARPDAEYPFERGVGEEPLRLAARVAATDAPWPEILTADWSMADEWTGPLWPTDYPAGGTGWRVVHYTDGRPAAGILATNGLWWRYFSTVSNFNRGRTAAIARLLLCEDYVVRNVSVVGFASETDTTDVEDNLRTNPYCLGCHSSLDPMATALFGFWPANEYSLDEIESYHPEREPLGPVLLDVEPAFYGQPFDGLPGLASLIAQDPRFGSCAAETFAGLLWRRPVVLEDRAEVADATAAYDADPRLKPVLRALTDGERYRAGAFTSTADDATLAREQVVRMLDAPLLASVLEDLTGLDWTWTGFSQLRNDTWGYRLLGGGVDGYYQTRSQSIPGMTWLLVERRAAESAACWAVDHELRGTDTPVLFTAVTVDDAPGSDAFRAQLTLLSHRLYGEAPDDAWIADVEALWGATAPTTDAATAWETTLAALLQDPRFTSY